MIEHKLKISAHYAPEILERILRVSRHRKFLLRKIEVNQIIEKNDIFIKLSVHSYKPINLLVTQLMKIFDVFNVKIEN